MIEISEVYVAPQGEGPNLGRPSLFVRFHRCNLQCSWCDSKFTWDKTDPGVDQFLTFDTVDQLVAHMIEVASSATNFFPTGVVFTGGEPLLWQKRGLLDVLLAYYQVAQQQYDTTVAFEIETAGTIMPHSGLIAHTTFNVSHKMRSSGNNHPRLWNDAATRRFIKASAIFKPVYVQGDEDEIADYVEWLVALGGSAMRDRIYIMPEGRKRHEMIFSQKRAIALAEKLGTRVTTRMHILAYSDERRR